MNSAKKFLIVVPLIFAGTAAPAWAVGEYLKFEGIRGESNVAGVVECPEDPNAKSDAWIEENCTRVEGVEIEPEKLEEYRSRAGSRGWVEIER